MTPARYLESNPDHKLVMVHRADLEEWDKQHAKFLALASAVGECSHYQVPENVYKAYSEPEGYWQSEVLKLREKVARLQAEVNRNR